MAQRPPRPRTRSRLLRWGQWLLLPAILAGVTFGILPRIADLDQVWSIVRGLTWREDAVLLAATLWNVFTYWPVAVAGLPGLTLGQAAVANQSATSVAMTLPGGGALGVGVSYAMYSSWGFTPSEIALSALVTGIWNIGLKLVLPVVALAVLVANGHDSEGLLATALVGVGVMAVAGAVLGLLLWSERWAMAIGDGAGRAASRLRRLVRRPPVRDWGRAAVAFRAKLLTLLRQRWLFLTTAAVLSQTAVYFVMLAAVRFVGIPEAQVGWAEVLTVFAFVRLASAVPIVPGNVGLAELGYIGGLVVAGADKSEAVAAVLVFRALTYYLQIPIGAFTYVAWQRKLSWRRTRRTPTEPASAATAQATPEASSTLAR